MTRERAKELLPVMQAFADGKEIQYRVRRDGEQWQDDQTTLPFLDDLDYRIKPQSREWWLVIYSDNSAHLCASEKEANEWNRESYHRQTNQIIHVKEVV